VIKQQRKDRGIFEDEKTGKKVISLVLGLDEPEIHLHPYMQRSLVKYLNSVISNGNLDFRVLIKDLFGIDEFIGQVIVVTHSPSVVLNDYRQIVRLYLNGGTTKVISGITHSLNAQLQKHLYLHFPFIKEAFFSKCVILVEGDSEYASFPHFASRMGFELDDHGISVIQARGPGIPQIMDILDIFCVPSVGIRDKDDNHLPPTRNNFYQTMRRDYEDEVACLIDSGKEHVLRNILCTYDDAGIERAYNLSALNHKDTAKYNLGLPPFTADLKLSQIPQSDVLLLKTFYLTWLNKNKSFTLGKVVGEILEDADIPQCFKGVINKAKEIAANG